MRYDWEVNMDKELVAHIVEHVKLANGGDGDDGEFEVTNAAAMLRLELWVHEYLMQLGREVVWNLAAEVGTGYQGPRVKRGEVVLRFKGDRPKTVHGLYGPVTIRRAYYASGSGETWVPRDEQLGIGGGQTPACEYHLGQFAGLGPYQRSLSHFHTIFRPTGVDQLSLHKTEQMVDALGSRLEHQRQQEIKELFDRGGGSVAVSAEITGTMVVCIDAGKAPTKGNERVDDDGRSRYDREFRDVKVASISVLEWDEVQQQARCSDTSYVLGIEHADDFFRRIWVEMNRRSHDLRHLRIVFIGDGADWIWHRAAEIGNPDSVYILDLCHAVDHLAKVAKLLYGEGSDQFAARLQQWRRKLRAGGAADVIDELRRLRDANRDHGDAIQRQINYLTANLARMKYQQYRQAHLPIGSGTVESACKHVVAARMKGSGMTWTLEGARHMLQLRAAIMSSRYAQDHQRSLSSPPHPVELLAAA